MTPPLSPAAPLRARPVLVVGVAGAAVAAVLAALCSADRLWLALVVLLAQLGFVVGWTSLLDVPGPVGAIAIGAGAAASSDGVLLKAHHVSLRDFATIVALAFLLALLWQIAREHRERVTEALASTLAGVVLAVAGGAWLTLRAGDGNGQSLVAGHQAATAALIGVAVALVIGRTVDAFWSRPSLSPSRRRGVPGLLTGVAAGVAAAAAYGAQVGSPFRDDPAVIYRSQELLTGGKAALVALAAVAVAVVVDLGLDAGLATLAGERSGPGGRTVPWPARLAVVALLPLLLAAPPAYVVARVVLT